jgi:hypothetical protein
MIKIYLRDGRIETETGACVSCRKDTVASAVEGRCTPELLAEMRAHGCQPVAGEAVCLEVKGGPVTESILLLRVRP